MADVPQHAKTASNASAGLLGQQKGHSSSASHHDRAYLVSKGWRERSCAGPWRWYRAEWKPLAYYTLHDAVSLERTRSKQTQPGGRK